MTWLPSGTPPVLFAACPIRTPAVAVVTSKAHQARAKDHLCGDRPADAGQCVGTVPHLVALGIFGPLRLTGTSTESILEVSPLGKNYAPILRLVLSGFL